MLYNFIGWKILSRSCSACHKPEHVATSTIIYVHPGSYSPPNNDSARRYFCLEWLAGRYYDVRNICFSAIPPPARSRSPTHPTWKISRLFFFFFFSPCFCCVRLIFFLSLIINRWNFSKIKSRSCSLDIIHTLLKEKFPVLRAMVYSAKYFYVNRILAAKQVTVPREHISCFMLRTTNNIHIIVLFCQLRLYSWPLIIPLFLDFEYISMFK